MLDKMSSGKSSTLYLRNMENTSTMYGRIKRAFGGIADWRIGKELGVSKQAVSQWRTGKTEPSEANLLKAEEKTGLPYKWLLTGDEKYLAVEKNQTASRKENSISEHESLFKDALKLNPEHRAKFDAIMEYARHQVGQMLEEQVNEPPRPKGKKS